jgi:SET domain-containing protein
MASKDYFYVARSKIHGRGLFARKKIKKGGLIGTFEGNPVKRDGTHVLWLVDESNGEEFGYRIVNDMRFVNHSKKPNSELFEFDLYAVKPIQPDEEIVMDYGWDE